MATSSGRPDERMLAIYRETIDPLYRYVSRQCGGDRALAEDVTQETWLRAVREWRRGGLPDEPAAWLRTVARNLVVSHFRRHRPEGLDALPDGDAPSAIDIERDAGSARDTAVVQRALAQIPAAQAGLLATFHFEDQRTADIAKQTGVSERAIEWRLRRARHRLRRELESLFRINGGRR